MYSGWLQMSGFCLVVELARGGSYPSRFFIPDFLYIISKITATVAQTSFNWDSRMFNTQLQICP